MASSAIEIVLDAKKRCEKERTKAKMAHSIRLKPQPTRPEYWTYLNKSEWIKQLANAAALILCEIETIQAIKGDGIIQQQ